jgi:hypothetical protein
MIFWRFLAKRIEYKHINTSFLKNYPNFPSPHCEVQVEQPPSHGSRWIVTVERGQAVCKTSSIVFSRVWAS